MRKDARINIRVSSDLFKLVKGVSDENKVSISGFVSTVLTEALVNNNMSDKLKKELKIYLIKIKRKELCNRLYIIKNMFSRIMDMSMSSYYVSGNINMKANNLVIDSFVEEFESYPLEIRNRIMIDFKIAVKQLRSEEFISSQSDKFRMLKMVTGK